MLLHFVRSSGDNLLHVSILHCDELIITRVTREDGSSQNGRRTSSIVTTRHLYLIVLPIMWYPAAQLNKPCSSLLSALAPALEKGAEIAVAKP